LLPANLKISRSLRKSIRCRGYRITADRDFTAVIEACAAPREAMHGTWITRQMKSAYDRLHQLGYAHSFEAWLDEELVGGLYGVAIGRVFFGESMFTRRVDASKVAFAAAVEFLRAREFRLIDCQVPSAHLTSLGATLIRRTEFVTLLEEHCAVARQPHSWRAEFAGSSVQELQRR
ncbi:MAG TPA: leucyl/phenylalanyl-tRNA--protein transferase, partial [Gammaproteobacteria bacterium]|nr:leucyl/phenylalanyl-tRNA--protein transferase [Gammaproteobacteria bacterium]